MMHASAKIKKSRTDENRSAFKLMEKIVLNTGIGKISGQPHFADKILPDLIREFSLIAGQKPAVRQAKQSIAGFKLREGTIVGLTSTVRGRRMNDLFERIIKIVLPRIRDFKGIRMESIDASGNLTIGIRESIVFPEINPDVQRINFGIEVTLVPKGARNREEALALYRELGVPFRKSSGRKA